MIAALYWYLTLLALGIVFYPISVKLFSGFRIAGLTVAKVLGLVLISFTLWFLSVTLKGPVIAFTLLACTYLFGVVSLVLYYKIPSEFNAHIKKHFRAILAEELLFIVLFVFYLLFKGINPAIDSIEKYMDHAIFTGLNQTKVLPPEDTWFSGHPVNYYYFGHYELSNLQKLTQIPYAIAFNLSVATVFALSGVLMCLLAAGITSSRTAGLVAMALLLFAGNLNYVLNKAVNWSASYFYADARSLIPFTINEFSAYSFLIGDLHAHILDIPHVLLLVMFAYAVSGDASIRSLSVKIIVGSILLAVLFMTNSWDYFIYVPVLMLFGVFLPTPNIMTNIRKNWYSHGCILLLSTFWVFLFSRTFSPATTGLLFTVPKNEVKELFAMFGGLLLLSLPLAFIKIDKILWRIGIIMFAYALVLIILPEFVILKDIYYKVNPNYMRANTFFKVWFQAWIILCILAGVSFKSVLSINKRFIKYAVVTLFVAAVAIFTSYFLYSAKYLMGKHYNYKGLDGAQFLTDRYPEAYLAINVLNSSISGRPVVLEIDGDSYTHESVFSTFTGFPTLVGWRDHELGWRDNWPEISQRMLDIRLLYLSKDTAQIHALLNKYSIGYFVIGVYERNAFGDLSSAEIVKFGDPVYSTENLTIYKVREI